MNAALVDASRHPKTTKATPSTSIRVSVATRDTLARAASAEGLSLTAYLERQARRVERELILADYRACAVEAYKDPEFLAEMREWDEMDDGVDFADERTEAR